jgi:hypothetical protein
VQATAWQKPQVLFTGEVLCCTAQRIGADSHSDTTTTFAVMYVVKLSTERHFASIANTKLVLDTVSWLAGVDGSVRAGNKSTVPEAHATHFLHNFEGQWPTTTSWLRTAPLHTTNDSSVIPKF